jgi:tellurite resistance protein TerA
VAPRTASGDAVTTLTREAPTVFVPDPPPPGRPPAGDLLPAEGYGALRATPRWLSGPGDGGGRPARLDLCALFELTDGSKGVVQSLGAAYGALDRPPYLRLGGDPQTGEHLTVRLDAGRAFRRVLLFVSAYGGDRGLQGLRGSVTLRPEPGAGGAVDFALDPCTAPATVCALALLTRDGPGLLVRREARYLVPRPGISPQRTVDYAYGWGLSWTPGRKQP